MSTEESDPTGWDGESRSGSSGRVGCLPHMQMERRLRRREGGVGVEMENIRESELKMLSHTSTEVPLVSIT